MKAILTLGLVLSFVLSSAQSASVIIMPKIMKKKEVNLIIREKNDSELDKLITKSMLFKNFQPIGFAAIPAGFLGAISLANNVPSDGGRNSSRNLKQNAGITLLALGAMCLTSSVYFNIRSEKTYKKAIQKYNQLYN